MGIALTTYHDLYNGEIRISDDELISRILRQIREKLKGIHGLGDRLYAYAALESWNLRIEFFATEEELAEFFVEKWGTAEETYEYMSDEELDDCYNCAEEEIFYSLPYSEIGFGVE